MDEQNCRPFHSGGHQGLVQDTNTSYNFTWNSNQDRIGFSVSGLQFQELDLIILHAISDLQKISHIL